MAGCIYNIYLIDGIHDGFLFVDDTLLGFVKIFTQLLTIHTEYMLLI